MTKLSHSSRLLKNPDRRIKGRGMGRLGKHGAGSTAPEKTRYTKGQKLSRLVGKKIEGDSERCTSCGLSNVGSTHAIEIRGQGKETWGHSAGLVRSRLNRSISLAKVRRTDEGWKTAGCMDATVNLKPTSVAGHCNL